MGGRDARRLFVGPSTRRRDSTSTVYISGTTVESANEGLPQEIVAAKDTHGRSVMTTLVARDDPPREVMVATAGISRSLPD